MSQLSTKLAMTVAVTITPTIDRNIIMVLIPFGLVPALL